MSPEEIKQLDETYAEGYRRAFPTLTPSQIRKTRRRKALNMIGKVFAAIGLILGFLLMIGILACGDS